MVTGQAPLLTLVEGTCYVLFAYDIGLSINLDEAERHITAIKQRSRIRHKRRAPQYFDYRPAPLRVTQGVEPLTLDDFRTATSVDLVIYDFGAVSVIYSILLEGPFPRVQRLSQVLYENVLLSADSRHRVEDLKRTIELMIERPKISDFMEDYVIFHMHVPPPTDVLNYSEELARILRSEDSSLSEQEARDATSCWLSFGKQDMAIIDWNASLLFGDEMEDVQAVLEFANMELLEMRYLDQQLDDALDQAYEALSKRIGSRLRTSGSFETDVRHVAQLQVDSAIMFERVTNTLKLIGDQYLARVYRLASDRFHLAAWDAGILRKLETLDSIYGKMADRAATRRMEVLEWIIIVLIAVSITISLLPGFSAH